MTTGGSASGSETRTSRANLPRNSFRTSSQAKYIPRGSVTAVATMAVCNDSATIEMSVFMAGAFYELSTNSVTCLDQDVRELLLS